VNAARRGAALVLQLRGEVDASTAGQIPAAVSAALAADRAGGPAMVILDLSGVTFFSAAGSPR
jgi:anti-anti-sigma factor